MIYIILAFTFVSLVLAIIFVRKGVKDAREMPDDYDDLSRRIDRAMYNEALKQKIKKFIEDNEKQ